MMMQSRSMEHLWRMVMNGRLMVFCISWGTLFLTVIISMNICLSILSIPKCMSSSIASWKKGMMRQLV